MDVPPGTEGARQTRISKNTNGTYSFNWKFLIPLRTPICILLVQRPILSLPIVTLHLSFKAFHLKVVLQVLDCLVRPRRRSSRKSLVQNYKWPPKNMFIHPCQAPHTKKKKKSSSVLFHSHFVSERLLLKPSFYMQINHNGRRQMRTPSGNLWRFSIFVNINYCSLLLLIDEKQYSQILEVFNSFLMLQERLSINCKKL